jgi:hypothetical protein
MEHTVQILLQCWLNAGMKLLVTLFYTTTNLQNAKIQIDLISVVRKQQFLLPQEKNEKHQY